MIPDGIEPLKPGGKRTLLSASTANELIALLNSLRWLEIEDHQPIWSDANVKFVRTDKTRPGESGESVGGEIEQFRVIAVFWDYLWCRRVRTSAIITSPGDIDESQNGGLMDIAFESESATDIVRIARPHDLRKNQHDETDPPNNEGRTYTYVDPPGTGSPPDTWAYQYRTISITDPHHAYLHLSPDPEPFESPLPIVEFAQTIEPKYDGNSIIYAQRVKQGPLFQVREATVLNPTESDYTTYNIDWIDVNADARRWENALRPIYVCNTDANGVVTRERVLIRCSEGIE